MVPARTLYVERYRLPGLTACDRFRDLLDGTGVTVRRYGKVVHVRGYVGPFGEGFVHGCAKACGGELVFP